MISYSSKEQWIILLVYLADSQLQKMSLFVIWAGWSKQHEEIFPEDENQPSR